MPGDAGSHLTTGDGRRPSVVVLDGNAVTAAVVVPMLMRFGCSVQAAASAEAALALLRRVPDVDLVVMDFGLRDMDPIVAAQLIRALGPRGAIPIVAIASNPALTTTPRGRAVGFARTLRKPYSPRDLHGAVEACLARARVPLPQRH
jgi:CheY-like chemotaxis protein